MIVACVGTFKGLDTALVVKAAGSMGFFKEFENWKGDLDKYYSYEPG